MASPVDAVHSHLPGSASQPDWMDALLPVLSKHFVSLIFKRSSGNSIASASGFLFAIGEAWWWITAGHVLADIKKARQSGQIAGGFHWDDSGCGYDRNHIPIPASFRNEDTIVLKGVEEQDYGSIRLNGLTQGLMQRAGKAPLTEEHLFTEADARAGGDRWPNKYLIIGKPAETIQTAETSSRLVVNQSLAFIECEPHYQDTDTDSEGFRRVKFQIPSALRDEKVGLAIDSISGVSGGPVFGLHLDGDRLVRYWILAVQSGWFCRSRKVVACPVRPFVEFLKS